MKTKIIVKAYNIRWDTDGEKVRLPHTVLVPLDLCDLEDNARDYTLQDMVEEQVGDFLSDKYGFCHNGYGWGFA